jgi:probable HAF family extracellular repeat protein
MKHTLVALATALVALQASAAAPASYTLVDLGTRKQPVAVNDSGTLIAYTAHKYLPLSYARGHWTHLPIEGTWGWPAAINSHGLVVGYDETGWNTGVAVSWKKGVRTELAGIPPTGQPWAVADDGTVVGSSYGAYGESYGFTWKDGVLTRLPDLGGGDSYAYTVDPTDTYIGGEARIPDSNLHAFIVDSAGIHDLGTLDHVDGESQVVAVNRHGHAAVMSNYAGSGGLYTAAYWTGKRLVDIGTHVGGVFSAATAINDSDDMLAYGSDGLGHTLFLFSGHDRVLTPIEPLIANPEGWSFDLLQTKEEVAVLANDGTIYGCAHFNGERHAFKLVPSAPAAVL